MMEHNLYRKKSIPVSYILLLIFVWTRRTFAGYIGVIVTSLFSSQLFGDLVIYTTYVVLILFSLNFIIRSLRRIDYFFVILCVLIYFVNILIYKDVQEYMVGKAVEILLKTIPVFFVGISIKRECIRYLRIASFASIISAGIYILTIGASKMGDDNMGIAYSILPSIVLLLFYFFEEKKIPDLIVGLFGSFLLFALGTRGPILLIGIAIAVYIFIFKSFKHKWAKYLCFIGVIWGAYIISSNYLLILGGLRAVVDTVGLSTRVIDGMMQATFLEDNSRVSIISTVWNQILQEPILGSGLCKDRILIEGSYTHNILLELMLSFGIPIGVVIFALIIRLIVKALIVSKNVNEVKLLIVCLFCTSGFLKLFLSSSFQLEYNFYLLLGICVGTNRFLNREKISYYSRGIVIGEKRLGYEVRKNE